MAPLPSEGTTVVQAGCSSSGQHVCIPGVRRVQGEGEGETHPSSSGAPYRPSVCPPCPPSPDAGRPPCAVLQVVVLLPQPALNLWPGHRGVTGQSPPRDPCPFPALSSLPAHGAPAGLHLEPPPSPALGPWHPLPHALLRRGLHGLYHCRLGGYPNMWSGLFVFGMSASIGAIRSGSFLCTVTPSPGAGPGTQTVLHKCAASTWTAGPWTNPGSMCSS